MSDINETLKKKIDELDLDRRLNEAVEGTEQFLRRAVETVGGLVHEHRDDVDRVVERVGDAIDQRTGGRYAEQVEKVRDGLDTGLGRLAEHRRPEGTAGTASTDEPGGPDPV